jgi:uncharacterized phage protein (TIGR02218 family)
MTYDTYESSVESGQPIELYEFLIGSTYYHYTSNAETIVVSGFTYRAIPISRGRLAMSRDDKSGDRIQITMPASEAFPQLYVNAIPGQRASMTIRRTHRNDIAASTVVIFKGMVQMVSFDVDATTAKITVLPVTCAQTRPIPRRTYSALCAHMLYDGRCQVVETSATWKKIFTVTTVSDADITCPGAGACGAGFFVAGFVTYNGDYRLVVAQAGDVLTLINPFNISPAGEVVVVNAGCQKTLANCASPFANTDNFGGFPFVPLVNPFESGM